MKYHVTKYIYTFNMKFEKKCGCTSNISKSRANWMQLCMNSSLDFNKKKFKCLINFISDYHKKMLMSFSYKLAYSINLKNLMLHKKCQKFMKFEQLDPRQHYKLQGNNLKFWFFWNNLKIYFIFQHGIFKITISDLIVEKSPQ
jgi:hypothetical protein